MEQIKTLSIDLETRSACDLKKTGVYRYSEDESFRILLFGVSINGAPPVVYDLASGEHLPDDLLHALVDDKVIKWAFNASFERVCISRWLKKNYPGIFRGHGDKDTVLHDYLNPASWRCSLVLSAYNGLPLSLEMAGAVLGFDKQKLKEGHDLIRYFCKPDKNGYFHTPEDDPAKWALFKSYNLRDVEVELKIHERLKNYSVPDSVWQEYAVDQAINDRGIMIDQKLVKNGIAIDKMAKDALLISMQDLTGLDNPNSGVQLKSWLDEQGHPMESLGKKEVKAAIPEAPEKIGEVLSLRLQAAKSSVKKYQAMEDTVCKDGRCHGMFFFYGANRTGRWCLTGDHEVLTRDGWVRLDEWQGGAIACWNASSEAASFQVSEALQFPYTGPMYTYTDARIDQCSTPDHKMRAKRRFTAEWSDMTVEEMAKCRPSIPITGYHYHTHSKNQIWLRVLIMTQADGYYTADGQIKYHFKKLRKVERCKHLLRQAEISFLCKQHGDAFIITIPTRSVPLWLREFRSKTFGYWLFEENPDVIFDELPHWDGYHAGPNSIQYSTVNKQNADILQGLAHMSGRCAVMKKKHHSNPKWQDNYILDIWMEPTNAHEIKVKPVITNFSGTVYCASTPTGYFLVRRNGRVWVTGNSGRNIQLQNLPQNHMPDLEEARTLVKQGDYDLLSTLYDNIPNVLSELIRTAFIPRPGYKFIVSDYSSIEARVLAYLSNETHVMKSFQEGKDLYCATASAMFGVPVVKYGVNGELRQKGKIATLACIAAGQLVLTDHGLVPIENVTIEMKVWDGENFVSHEGVIYKGEKEVITYDGLTATKDHLVFTEGRSDPIPFAMAKRCGEKLKKTGDGLMHEDQAKPSLPSITPVYDIRNAGPHHRFTVSGVLVHNCGYGGSVGALKAMGALDMGLKEEELQSIVDRWRDANPHIVAFWWAVDRAVKDVVKYRTTTTVGCLKFYWKSGMLMIDLPSGRRLSYVKPAIGENKFGGESVTYMGIDAKKKWSRLESYGPKFVENITQAIARDVLCYAMRNLRDLSIVGHVHDELIIEVPESTDLQTVCDIMGKTPPWAPGLLLRADGYECAFYKKD